jgi:hypothetical protein
MVNISSSHVAACYDPENRPASGEYIIQKLKITISILCYGYTDISPSHVKHL